MQPSILVMCFPPSDKIFSAQIDSDRFRWGSVEHTWKRSFRWWVNKSISGLCSIPGCVQTISVIGPVFGYLLGSLCAKIYVDFEHVDMGEEDKRRKVFWTKYQNRNWKWNLQVKVNLTGHISAQKLWLSPLRTRAGWGRGGWVTSSLVPSRSYLPFPFGSCPNRCPSLWTNTISAARQSKPGSSQTPQTWSTSSDRRSLRTCSRWSKVWEPSQQPLAWFFGYGAQISSL